jgi:hypothetical protein
VESSSEDENPLPYHGFPPHRVQASYDSFFDSINHQPGVRDHRAAAIFVALKEVGNQPAAAPAARHPDTPRPERKRPGTPLERLSGSSTEPFVIDEEEPTPRRGGVSILQPMVDKLRASLGVDSTTPQLVRAVRARFDPAVPRTFERSEVVAMLVAAIADTEYDSDEEPDKWLEEDHGSASWAEDRITLFLTSGARNRARRASAPPMLAPSDIAQKK